MTKSELITVIVPVYKVEPYLDRCISSIVEQTYGNLEIILIDDDSPDRCPTICDEWAAKNSRIHVIHKENGGVSSARNAGLRVATGDWISFVDSDDWIHPRFFEILYMQTLKYPMADVFALGMEKVYKMCSYKEIDLDVPCFYEVPVNGIFRNRTIRNYVWGKIYRTNLIKTSRFDEQISFGEDSLFNAKLFSDPVHLYYCEEKLYYYFQRGDSAVHKLKPYQLGLLQNAYLDLACKENRSVPKGIYTTEAIKRALALRYEIRYDQSAKETKEKTNLKLKTALKMLWSINTVSLKEKSIYTLFSYVPTTYRIFRIIDDPTLIIWESEKRKAKKYHYS